MADEIPIGNVSYEKPVYGFTEEEMNKYDGTRVKIAKVFSDTRDKPYKDGNMLPKNSDGSQQTVATPMIVVQTEPLKIDSSGNPVCVEAEFPLKHDAVKNSWTLSMNEKSNVYKFLRKYTINRLEEIQGRDVILSKKVNSKGKTSLGISFG